jgi:hypothetical protein
MTEALTAVLKVAGRTVTMPITSARQMTDSMVAPDCGLGAAEYVAKETSVRVVLLDGLSLLGEFGGLDALEQADDKPAALKITRGDRTLLSAEGRFEVVNDVAFAIRGIIPKDR